MLIFRFAHSSATQRSESQESHSSKFGTSARLAQLCEPEVPSRSTEIFWQPLAAKPVKSFGKNLYLLPF